MSNDDDRSPRTASGVTRADVLVAIAAFAVAASTAALGSRVDQEPFTWTAALTLAAQSAPLAWRRQYPIVSAAVVGVFAVCYGIVDWADPLVPVPAIVSLAAVFEYAERRAALIVLGVAGVASIAATGLAGDSDPLDWGVVVLTLVLSPVIGELMRERRQEVRQLEARNERLELERQRAVEDARLAERQRIARELHDVVTHNVTMLVVRAEAAASTTPMSEAERVAAFDALADGGRDALGELRQLLGVLRDPNERAPAVPSAGIARVDELVAGARAAGLDVGYESPGGLPELAGAVDLAAYRVVQEGLTNVVRHAAARRADVTIALADDALVVDIEDDGVGVHGEAVDGVGLAGLRERIRLLGGTLDAGAAGTGGFRLRARIPCGAPP
jgi:signal transduction histidine kinase